MDTVFPLDQIDANPWQPRAREDGEHIKNLALSIAADGLMQVPVGRMVGGRVQLAFGHSRLAAYRWLADVKNNSNLAGDWAEMPVLIRDLADEEMFRLGVSENLQRKDLSPIEEARAMLRFRDEFRANSGEIGRLFGLAESSVRNKMRLVQLPEEIQAALLEGRISEGAARELISFYELPEAVRRRPVWGTGVSGAITIPEAALKGAPAEEVRELITNAVKAAGANLSGVSWKWEREFDLALDARLVSVTCQACALRVVRDRASYCMGRDCREAREALVRKEILAAASAATGIRVAEDVTRSSSDYVELYSEDAKEIREGMCDNLRLVYTTSIPSYRMGGIVEGHPNVLVMCGRLNHQCSCKQGIDARRRLAAAGLETRREAEVGRPGPVMVRQAGSAGQPAAAPSAGGVTSRERIVARAEELHELAKQEKRMKKVLIEEVQEGQREFARRLAQGFENRNSYVMVEALLYWMYTSKKDEMRSLPAGDILQLAMMHIAEEEYNLSYISAPDPGKAMADMNKVLKRAGLAEMVSQAAAGEPVYVPVEGKTVAEVFEAEEERQGFNLRLLPGQQDGERLADYFARGGDAAA